MTPRSLRPFAIVTLLLACATCNSRPQPPAAPPRAPEGIAIASPTSKPTTQVVVAPPDSIEPRDTVPFLASAALAGRAPGTPGLERASQFIADRFAHIGLTPLPGMRDFFQPFTMPLANTLAPGTNLLVNDRSLALSTDFSPLYLTGEGRFSGRLVFAGYGITRGKSEPSTQPTTLATSLAST